MNLGTITKKIQYIIDGEVLNQETPQHRKNKPQEETKMNIETSTHFKSSSLKKNREMCSLTVK